MIKLVSSEMLFVRPGDPLAVEFPKSVAGNQDLADTISLARAATSASSSKSARSATSR